MIGLSREAYKRKKNKQTNYVENWIDSLQIPYVRSPCSLQKFFPSEGSGCDDRIFQETNINYKRKKETKLSQWREDSGNWERGF